DHRRVLGMGGNGPDGGGLRQAARDQFPFVVTHGHPVQARFDDEARRSLARQAHIHIGRVIRCHSSFLLAGSTPRAKPAVYWLDVFHQKASGMSIAGTRIIVLDSRPDLPYHSDGQALLPSTRTIVLLGEWPMRLA